MKTIQTLFTIGAICWAASVSAADLTTTLFTINDLEDVTTHTIDIETGGSLEVQSILSKNRLLKEIYIEVDTVRFGPYVYDDDTGKWSKGPGNTGGAWSLNSGLDNALFIAGPAKLHIVSFGGIGDSGYVAVTAGRTGGAAVATAAASQSMPVVIPSDADGQVEIVMESSSDMVNWTRTNPGTYGSDSEQRFFRIRAVNIGD